MHAAAAIAASISIASDIRPTMLHCDQCNEIIKTIIFLFLFSLGNCEAAFFPPFSPHGKSRAFTIFYIDSEEM